MEKVYSFYVLSASSDANNIRYVGVTTKTVNQRFYGHKYCAMHEEKRGLPVHKWMYSHYQKGEDIIVNLIDTCKSSEWEMREQYWISYYKEKGFDLLNVSKGGIGVVTREMRDENSIERSVKGHEKAIVALNLDGTFYKEFASIKEATDSLGLKSKSSISNVLKKRSKSSGGYLWVYKSEYNSDENYTYQIKKTGKTIYQFDINGILVNSYPSKKYFDRLEGWSSNGVNSAIKNKSIYHDYYWSTEASIDISDFEPYFVYQEYDNQDNIINYYHSQTEICNKFNISPSIVCTKIKEHKIFPNGNYISKL